MTALLLLSCQQYEPYTQEEVFKGAYKRNFVRSFGAIDPTIDWDFSDRMAHGGGMDATRSSTSVIDDLNAVKNSNGYYEGGKALIDNIRQQIKSEEKTDRSFAFWLEEGACFDIYPVYMTSFSNGSNVSWVLQMFVGNENLIPYADKNYPGWVMGEGVRVKSNNTYKNIGNTGECTNGVQSRSIIRYTHEGGNQLMHLALCITGVETKYAIKGTQQSSLNYQMRILDVPKPSNIGDHLETCFIACDAVDIDCPYMSGGRYRSLVLMMVGQHLPEVVYVRDDREDTKAVEACVSGKRFMIEDLGSASDFDFNDVVVDVEEIESTPIVISQKTKSGINGKLTSIQLGEAQPLQTVATVRCLCGTLPFKLYIGEDSFGPVTDPTNQQQTRLQLQNQALDHEPTFFRAPVDRIGWQPNVRMSVSAWDPSMNNLSVEVWPNGSEDLRVGGWKADFPHAGEVPFMMALPTSTSWSAEGLRFTEWQQYVL